MSPPAPIWWSVWGRGGLLVLGLTAALLAAGSPPIPPALPGGPGVGPSLGLSPCAAGFDPGLARVCSFEVGPLPGSGRLCPVHAGPGPRLRAGQEPRRR